MLTAKQQKIRSKGIGASEVAALMGLDPYRTKLDIYLRKMGLADDVKSFHTDRGNFLEPALRAWASAKVGVQFQGNCPTLTCKDHPQVLATPDGIALDGDTKHVLELKAPGPRTAWEWGDGEEAPDRYVVQLAQQQLVTEAPDGYLAALVDGDLRTYHYARDPDLEGEIVTAVEKFWRDHIAKKSPPPVDGSASASEYLKRVFPRSRGDLITADGSTETLLLACKQARIEAKAAEQKAVLLEQQIKSLIGERDGITSPWGKVLWRNNEDGERTDWQGVALALGATPEVIKEHTKTTPGPRVFRFGLK